MCKFKDNGEHNRIDKCMKPLIQLLSDQGYKTIACCCGHNKYPMTIIVKPELYPEKGGGFEILSSTYIPRKRKFYKKDKKGYYYIPEVKTND